MPPDLWPGVRSSCGSLFFLIRPSPWSNSILDLILQPGESLGYAVSRSAKDFPNPRTYRHFLACHRRSSRRKSILPSNLRTSGPPVFSSCVSYKYSLPFPRGSCFHLFFYLCPLIAKALNNLGNPQQCLISPYYGRPQWSIRSITKLAQFPGLTLSICTVVCSSSLGSDSLSLSGVGYDFQPALSLTGRFC